MNKSEIKTYNKALENDEQRIDLFLKTLGSYWKENKELSFSDLVEMLDREYNLKKQVLEVDQLTLMLDQLILETSYPELREEIARTYANELESMEEKAQEKLITTILKWYLSGKGYIKSTAMKLRVEGYIETYKK